MPKNVLRRHSYFLLFVLGSFLIFWKPLGRLIDFSSTHDYGSHIILIAPISAYLIYLRRRNVFSKVRADFLTGFGLLLPAAFLGGAAHFYSCVSGASLSVEIVALGVLWIAGFALCYGTDALRAACFPLLFLVLMIPIPDFLIEKVIFFLQTGSAAVSYWLFRRLGVPVFKEGFVFILPSLNIEVAKECSGIRSSMALLITTLLAGEFVLRSGWRKALLVLSAVPILIFKNGVRIVTISLLSIYVDPRFLHGWIHTSGGIVFYMLALLCLFPVIVVLKRGESENTRPAETHVAGPAPATRLQDSAFGCKNVQP